MATRIVRVGNAVFGSGTPAVIAGPCSVENREMILSCAATAAECGAAMLRGGAFKPRTSPYSFLGLGLEGLELLDEARRLHGLPVVTEVLACDQIGPALDHADMLQVGARNMHNFALLTELGRAGCPVLLKRGFMATVEEWLLAAEYLIKEGNESVVLCERGIRTFEPWTRNTLDISSVPLAREKGGLPVIVDPCHASGRSDLVAPLSMAALAAGADGLMIEIHPEPARALSDGGQSLGFDAFRALSGEIRRFAAFASGSREGG